MAKFTFDASAFDEIENELNDLANKVHNSDESTVSIYDLFNTDFMSRHARSIDIDNFFTLGNIDIENCDDLDSLSNDEFDKFVSEHTDFSSWEEMCDEAINCHVDEQLDL